MTRCVHCRNWIRLDEHGRWFRGRGDWDDGCLTGHDHEPEATDG